MGNIRWRIAAVFAILVLACIGGLSAYLFDFVSDDYLDNLRTQLAEQARLVADASLPYFESGQVGDIDALTKDLGNQVDARITIIDRGGRVLGDSDKDPLVMENHASRPEVAAALAGGEGSSIRHSATLGYDMMYVAVPLVSNSSVVGVARVALPQSGINESLGHIKCTIIGGAAIATVVAVLLAIWLSRTITKPLVELTRVSKKMAEGELAQKISVASRDEAGELTRSFNLMADRLKEMVKSISTERDKLSAILSNMADGIIITDGEFRITTVNRAAESILRVSGDKVCGSFFIEVVRDHKLYGMLQSCRESGEQQTSLVEFRRGNEFLGVTVTSLPTPTGTNYLMLIQNLTELHRLDGVRRDFVANIAHELHTPLASIKALSETLLEGAIDDSAVAQEFLTKMDAEVDRLTQMVHELRELSRIESGELPLRMEPTDVGVVVEHAADRLRTQAERAGLKLIINVPPDIPPALADSERIEQVLVNLLHNAIKFTSPGGEVTISVRSERNNVLLSVIDTGIGIAADDLPRIFERFYKSDKARSGGGTGLGLAIAKHIVQEHGGRIWAESEEGKGATFTFTLPINT